MKEALTIQLFSKKKYITDCIKCGDISALVKLLHNNQMVILKDNDEKFSNIPLGYGAIIEGRAYSHEDDSYYVCIGFEVKNQTKTNFRGENKTSEDYGFYSIWCGSKKNWTPVDFSEGYSDDYGKAHRYSNGCGDHIEPSKILVSREKVIEEMKKLGIFAEGQENEVVQVVLK